MHQYFPMAWVRQVQSSGVTESSLLQSNIMWRANQKATYLAHILHTSQYPQRKEDQVFQQAGFIQVSCISVSLKSYSKCLDTKIFTFQRLQPDVNITVIHMWVTYLHTMYNYEDKQTLQKYENIMANSVFTQYTFLFISVLSLFKFFCLSLLQGHSLKSFHKSSNWFLRAGPAFVMCLNNTLA